MRLNFLKTQFSKFADWYETFTYRVNDYFETIRFNTYGFDYKEDDVHIWLTSLNTSYENFKKDHKFKHYTFIIINFVVDFPLNVSRYWKTFCLFVAPESFSKVDGKIIRTSDMRVEYHFQTTAMYVLFEKFRMVFEETLERLGDDDLRTYDENSQNIYIRQIELYRWWMWRRNLDVNSLPFEQQEQVGTDERKYVRELVEISDWI